MANCRACGEEIIIFFSLGEMPLVNSFLRKRDIPKEKKYDLSVSFCKNCFLVQLMETVDPKELFRNYIYFSSATQSILDHSKKTAEKLVKKLHLTSKSLVLEIGSNDGVQLQYYKKIGIPVLGVDPAKNIAKVANERGIETIAEFFRYKFAKKLVKKGIRADMVYGANVFAHVPHVVDFVKGVEIILKNKGTAVFEFPYLQGLMENKFDTIYHEHVFYYSLIALKNLLQQANLQIYDVEEIPMQGGSLRIFFSRKGDFKVSPRVEKLIEREYAKGFQRLSTYKKITIRVNALKRELVTLLKKLKEKGKRIVAYGAPAKGNILLNYFEISSYLDYIVDKSEAKQELYTPGTHMYVYSPSRLLEQKPDYLLILCWNIADEVIGSYQDYRKSGGKFILPVPKVQVIA